MYLHYTSFLQCKTIEKPYYCKKLEKKRYLLCLQRKCIAVSGRNI